MDSFLPLVVVDVHVSFHSSFPNAMPWKKIMTKSGFGEMHFWLRLCTGIIYTLEHNGQCIFRIHINVAFRIIKHHKINIKSSIFVRIIVIWR
jgi:hypothetical protein